MNNQSELVVKNLCASYKSKKILKDVSLKVERGKLTCIVGKNGSGKTTLLRAIANAKHFSNLVVTGTITTHKLDFENNSTCIDLRTIPSKDRARIISYMPQSEQPIWDFTAFDVILTGRFCHTKLNKYSNNDKNIALCAMETLNILDLQNRNVRTLSGGEWQKVRLARCIAQDAPFMLLDEPLRSLDFGFASQFLYTLKSILKEKKLGVLITVHDLNIVAHFADSVVVMRKDETCIQGSVKEMFTPEILDKAYNYKFSYSNQQIDFKDIRNNLKP